MFKNKCLNHASHKKKRALTNKQEVSSRKSKNIKVLLTKPSQLQNIQLTKQPKEKY